VGPSFGGRPRGRRCLGGARRLEALADKYPPYAGDPPPGPVVAIEIETISGWEAEPDGPLEDRS